MMGYVEKNLMPDEKVVYSERLHWVIYAPAITIVVAGIACPVFFGLDGLIWGVVLIIFIAPLLALNAWIKIKTSEFAITNRRMMMKVGLIRRHTLEMLLGKVENISVDQTVLGRLLGYGSITITGTGGTPEPFKRIADPLKFRQHVQDQVASAQAAGWVAAAPRPVAAAPEDPQRECPYCAERILAKARVCKHCGRDVDPIGA